MKNHFKILFIIAFAFQLVSCNNNAKKNEPKQDEKTSSPKTSEQILLSQVETIHKKNNYLNEDVVTYQIDYRFGNLNDELKIKAATDLSRIIIESKNFGKSYYNGTELLIDVMANAGDREVKRNFQLLYFYHAFFYLSDNNFNFSPTEEVRFDEQNYKQVKVQNENVHTAFFPTKASFLIDNRTNMMKGLILKTALLGNGRSAQNIHLQYDRFITVNHIPVSLDWKFYPKNEHTEESLLGEAKVTRIKYYSAEQLQLSIPENAKPIKNSPIL